MSEVKSINLPDVNSRGTLAISSCEFCRKPMLERSKIIKSWREYDAKAELKSNNRFCQVTNACGTFRVNAFGSVNMLQFEGRTRVNLSLREIQALAAMDTANNDDWDCELKADPSLLESYKQYNERELERNEIACGGGSMFVCIPRKIMFLVEKLSNLY